MADMLENDVQLKALNKEAKSELLFPITKANLVKDLNFFGKIKVGNTGITAVGIDSILELATGAGLKIGLDNTKKKLTINIDTDIFITKSQLDNIVIKNTAIFDNYKYDDSIDLRHVLTD